MLINIIDDIYSKLLNTVILKDIPREDPFRAEISVNYWQYLYERYKRLNITSENMDEIKSFIVSEQQEIWLDAMPYNIYRKFVVDHNYDHLVKTSNLSFRLAHIAHEQNLFISRLKRDEIIRVLTERSKRVKNCFVPYANDLATEGYKDVMYASGDKGDVSERLKQTIEDEKGY